MTAGMLFLRLVMKSMNKCCASTSLTYSSTTLALMFMNAVLCGEIFE